MKEDIKVFVSCHKPSDCVQNDLFLPIQVGTGLPGRKKIPNLRYYDNTGDNISLKNPRFCELTAQYWAWKNTDADYFGFFHYRRYLSFKKKNSLDAWGNVVEPCISEEVSKKHRLDEKNIRDLVGKYDVIIPRRKNIKMMPNMGSNMREQFSINGILHDEDLKIMTSVIKEKYPSFLKYTERYLQGHCTVFCNMFIMKKNFFDDYCQWLFDILDECDKKINYRDYSVEALRTPGHLAERLFNIYMLYLEDAKKAKVVELDTIFFQDVEPLSQLKPAFSKNNVAIAMSADMTYAPFIATAINSILRNSSKQYNYDIIILHKNIGARDQLRIQNVIKNNKNFSIRFMKVVKLEQQIKKLFTRGHFTIETWFRLALPELLRDYKKILYLDSDLVVNNDVADLYNTNIDGFLLAACRDADTAGLYNGFEPNKKKYMDSILKIKNPYDYFQAGVILFNLEEFRKTYSTSEMISFASSYDWELLDQDVLNYLAQGRVKFVDMAWNVMFDWNDIRVKDIISRGPKRLYDEYMVARLNPKIIHFAGPDKPWLNPSCDFGEFFWKNAQETEYYEKIISFIKSSETGSNIKRLGNKLLPANTLRGKAARRVYKTIK